MADRVSIGSIDEGRAAVLFDAQTSGGLLIAVDPSKTDQLHAALAERGVNTAVTIGRVVEARGTITIAGG